jgi:RNA polymerase sigma-70 factor (ECF subfamily)
MDQRNAVVLRHVADLPIAEIAEITGRPEGTIKADISRGLDRLRDALTREELK